VQPLLASEQCELSGERNVAMGSIVHGLAKAVEKTGRMHLPTGVRFKGGRVAPARVWACSAFVLAHACDSLPIGLYHRRWGRRSGQLALGK
jgi:hypothetical protein